MGISDEYPGFPLDSTPQQLHQSREQLDDAVSLAQQRPLTKLEAQGLIKLLNSPMSWPGKL